MKKIKTWFAGILKSLIIVTGLSFSMPANSIEVSEFAALAELLPINPSVICLASALWHEARGEGVHSKIAVGKVIQNRVDSEHFEEGVCKVLKQPRQFPWVKRGKVPEKYEDEDIVLAKLLYYDFINEDPTKGSLFFHAKYVNPGWNYRRVVTIGNHIFYGLRGKR